MSSASLSLAPGKSARDQRLDLARGVMLVIIFVAHVPNNLWADYIPARFGFSSGAEIFVFCSGIASGLAFGGTFLKKGFAQGVRRIFKRVAQLYTAHLGSVLVLGSFALLLDRKVGNDVMAMRYDLVWLRDMPFRGFLDYATLRYIPAFFDIMPMYVILLALVIPAMALARVSAMLVLAASLAVWLLMQLVPFHFPGNPVTGGPWYFNPFAWQFLFFIGFSFGVRWLKAPTRQIPWLFWLSIIYLAVSVPINFWGAWSLFPMADAINKAIYPADAITILHITRLLHFLSLAYVCYSLVDPKATWLSHPRLLPLYRIGRNSFGCFLAGLGLSMLGGVVIDHLGLNWTVAHGVNLCGIALLLLIAYGLDSFDQRQSKRRLASAEAGGSTVADHRRKTAEIA